MNADFSPQQDATLVPSTPSILSDVSARTRDPHVRARHVAEPPMSLTVFSTALGWCGVLGRLGEDRPQVRRLWIGHASAARVRQSAARFVSRPVVLENDANGALRERIQAYCGGALVDFTDVILMTDHVSAFRQRVRNHVRAIPFGQTRTYGEIAALAGSPRAARAVGNAMAANPVPLIVPCHRVLPATGGLGGFSAPTGVRLKRRLLRLEGCTRDDLPLP